MWTPAQAACTRSQHALRRVRRLMHTINDAAVGSPHRPPRELCPSIAARMTVTLPATPGQSPRQDRKSGLGGLGGRHDCSTVELDHLRFLLSQHALKRLDLCVGQMPKLRHRFGLLLSRKQANHGG